MRLKIMLFLLIAAASGYSFSVIQPAISPDGVVNAASYVARGFSNHGIARGSLFLIFGNYLGPDTLVQAASYPLVGSDGLAGTRVRIDAGGYTTFALMVYTSAKQVAAILPSDAPEGDATLTLNYNNLTSNPVVIHIVTSAFGMFTQNQGGFGPAVVQNFVSATQTPLNTLVSSAAPGQTVILWGTGLGPINGNDASGPAPGALPYLNSLIVGGQTANVRYAGRSGCCAGVDQISFDIPTGVSGCYVPVSVLSGGVVSNVGTISISASGKECDDPLSFRASDLSILEQTGRLRLGTVEIQHQTTAGQAVGSNSVSASFLSYTPPLLEASTPQPFNVPVGTCNLSETSLSASPAAMPGTGLNLGFGLVTTGPGVNFMVGSDVPGIYSMGPVQGNLVPGTYLLSGNGGPDVGAFSSQFSVGNPVTWTNASDYSTPVVAAGQPMTLRWTGGDAAEYVRIRIQATSATLSTSIYCNAPIAAGSFTVPAYLTKTLVQGQGSISVGTTGNRIPFSAPGLDAATVVPESSTVVQTNFQTPVSN